MVKRFKDLQEIQRHALARGAEAVIDGRSFNAGRRTTRQAPKGTALPPPPPPPPAPAPRRRETKTVPGASKPTITATTAPSRAYEPHETAYPRTVSRAVEAAPHSRAPAPTPAPAPAAAEDYRAERVEPKRPCAVKTQLKPVYTPGGYLQSMSVRTECDDGSVKEHRVEVQYTQSGVVSGMTITPTTATTGTTEE